MNEWERLFSTLESTDLSYRKNLKRLKKGSFFHKIKKSDLILDLFCGRCDTGYGLKDYGYRIISGDISFKLLKINKEVKNKIQLNSLALPFCSNQFKGIIIQGGLQRSLIEPRELLDQLPSFNWASRQKRTFIACALHHLIH